MSYNRFYFHRLARFDGAGAGEGRFEGPLLRGSPGR